MIQPPENRDPSDYLDHAATSWPKPLGVVEAVVHWHTDLGVSADRGDGDAVAETRRRVDEVRRELAELLNTTRDRVAFTSGATESLHLAFTALLRPGDRVVTTRTEHSSVARPLRARDDLDLHLVDCDPTGRVDPGDLVAALRERETRLLVVNEASNVTGAIQELGPVLAAAKELGVITLVDACQSLGATDRRIPHAPDLIAASAHKALLGPPGLGVLALGRDSELRIDPPKPGGSGSSRALDTHPDHWPAVVEAGTPNTPAILGLGAALDWRSRMAPDPKLGLELVDRLADALEERIPGLRTIRPSGPRTAILSLTIDGFDPAELGMLLAGRSLQARSGFHCAPWIHESLGTEAGGTLRLSPGPFVTDRVIDRVIESLGG